MVKWQWILTLSCWWLLCRPPSDGNRSSSKRAPSRDTLDPCYSLTNCLHHLQHQPFIFRVTQNLIKWRTWTAISTGGLQGFNIPVSFVHAGRTVPIQILHLPPFRLALKCQPEVLASISWLVGHSVPTPSVGDESDTAVGFFSIIYHPPQVGSISQMAQYFTSWYFHLQTVWICFNSRLQVTWLSRSRVLRPAKAALHHVWEWNSYFWRSIILDPCQSRHTWGCSLEG
jgi:hypothetical protein